MGLPFLMDNGQWTMDNYGVGCADDLECRGGVSPPEGRETLPYGFVFIHYSFFFILYSL